MHPLAELDIHYVWHPFTQMKDWVQREPILIVEGDGATVSDAHGRDYIDANSSIWTSLHGHRCKAIDRALKDQLKKIAHSSYLGFANEPASILAEQLVKAANPENETGPRFPLKLSRVFYSDDGSTAMEVALKQAYEYARRTGLAKTPRFLSVDGAYHGDTVGAVSIGHIDQFHKAYGGLLFQSDKVMSPACYRCPYNKARPERADARTYRDCHWECVGKVEEACARQAATGEPYAAMVVEPALQGAAGMIAHPKGWLFKVSEILKRYGTLLIADEVMTGLGRAVSPESGQFLFASHAEEVQADFLVLAKGLTGGYLPMAATLTTDAVYNAFLGEYCESKTFFHGHSYSGNALGAAAAVANLELLAGESVLHDRQHLAEALRQGAVPLWDIPQVGDIRQVGTVLAVELVRDWATRAPFAWAERIGQRVCASMAQRGVLTRPVGNVIVIMPPYCTTTSQAHTIMAVLYDSINEVFPSPHEQDLAD